MDKVRKGDGRYAGLSAPPSVLPRFRRLPGAYQSGLGRSPKFLLFYQSIYTRTFPTQSSFFNIIHLTFATEIKLQLFKPIQIKVPPSTMTLSPQTISINPISVPSSDVDFGTVIENVDLENLTGK